MYLKHLQLRQFRNYSEQEVNFFASKTILLGDNAQGKSNLLESVGLLSSLKSYRAGRDSELVKDGASIAQIIGYLEKENGPVELNLTLRSKGQRTCSINGNVQRRKHDFIGKLNAVQFSCLDLDLVRGGPDNRRNWLDNLLLQLEPVYASILQQYLQVLKQRNALLKKLQAGVMGLSPEQNTPDATELALWDAQLATLGTRVTRRRARVLARLTPIAQTWHTAISGQLESLEIRYAPNLGAVYDSNIGDDPEKLRAAFLEQIKQKSTAETHQGVSLVGPHRDEVELIINQTPARQYGSQGQQRTLVLALKLAELKLIEEVVGEAPLLLLDDVLAELDPRRQMQLLTAIQDRFQTIITTTHLSNFDSSWLAGSQILAVKEGKIYLD